MAKGDDAFHLVPRALMVVHDTPKMVSKQKLAPSEDPTSG